MNSPLRLPRGGGKREKGKSLTPDPSPKGEGSRMKKPPPNLPEGRGK